MQAEGEVYYGICLLSSSDFVYNHCWNTVAILSEMIGQGFCEL